MKKTMVTFMKRLVKEVGRLIVEKYSKLNDCQELHFQEQNDNQVQYDVCEHELDLKQGKRH